MYFLKEYRFKKHIKKFGHKNKGYFNYFNKEWFIEHQSTLIWLLNNWLLKYWFRWILRIYKDCKFNEYIDKIEPHTYRIKVGENTYRSDFRTHQKFSKRIYYAFRPLWWILHSLDWLIQDILQVEFSFSFDTLTSYPDADPETSTVDGGTCGRSDLSTWATVIAAAGAAADDTNQYLSQNYFDTGMNSIYSHTNTNTWRLVSRTMTLFDTSALTASVTISGAILSIWGNYKTDPLSITPNIDIYTCTPASNTGLVAADQAQYGSVSQTGSPISYASWNTAGYNDFTFNATGISNISKTSISKFSQRNANYDVAAVAPTWLSSAGSHLAGWAADRAGTSQDPKLVITYSLPVTFVPQIIII
ncbi:MAG: hypothetical protein ABIJ40_09550 [Bacteroidota bacterium]